MNLSNLIFLDTETTGGDNEDRICQLSWKYYGQPFDQMFDELFKPPVRISIESMAIHHITEKMVAHKPLFVDADGYAHLKSILEKLDSVIVAHNAPFDVAMLKKEKINPTNSIDTLKLIRHFDPLMKIKRHNLQYLRYFLKIDDEIDIAINPHDAKSDVIILELIFKRLYQKAKDQFELKTEEEVIAKLIQLSIQPAYIGKFAFGKYVGELVTDVVKIDPGYLRWLLDSKKHSDQDETDWIFTLEKVLGIS